MGTLGFEEFTSVVEQDFRVRETQDGPEIARLRLAQIRGKAERPFSLDFEDSANARLDQGTYWLANEAFGEAEIFLVPVGPTRYEAVFN